jgi:hypothetical protein
VQTKGINTAKNDLTYAYFLRPKDKLLDIKKAVGFPSALRLTLDLF